MACGGLCCLGVMMPLFCCVCDGVGVEVGVRVGVVVSWGYDSLVLLCLRWRGVGVGVCGTVGWGYVVFGCYDALVLLCL